VRGWVARSKTKQANARVRVAGEQGGGLYVLWSREARIKRHWRVQEARCLAWLLAGAGCVGRRSGIPKGRGDQRMRGCMHCVRVCVRLRVQARRSVHDRGNMGLPVACMAHQGRGGRKMRVYMFLYAARRPCGGGAGAASHHMGKKAAGKKGSINRGHWWQGGRAGTPALGGAATGWQVGGRGRESMRCRTCAALCMPCLTWQLAQSWVWCSSARSAEHSTWGATGAAGGQAS